MSHIPVPYEEVEFITMPPFLVGRIEARGIAPVWIPGNCLRLIEVVGGVLRTFFVQPATDSVAASLKKVEGKRIDVVAIGEFIGEHGVFLVHKVVSRDHALELLDKADPL